jgi:hypothetical protein
MPARVRSGRRTASLASMPKGSRNKHTSLRSAALRPCRAAPPVGASEGATTNPHPRRTPPQAVLPDVTYSETLPPMPRCQPVGASEGATATSHPRRTPPRTNNTSTRRRFPSRRNGCAGNRITHSGTRHAGRSQEPDTHARLYPIAPFFLLCRVVEGIVAGTRNPGARALLDRADHDENGCNDAPWIESHGCARAFGECRKPSCRRDANNSRPSALVVSHSAETAAPVPPYLAATPIDGSRRAPLVGRNPRSDFRRMTTQRWPFATSTPIDDNNYFPGRTAIARESSRAPRRPVMRDILPTFMPSSRFM